MSAEETVALVDERGQVVGSAPRSRMRRENLRHASTAVLVRDSSGRIYVTRRSADKDWWPSAHDAAAGGVVQHGEAVDVSAARELAEELGITDVPLRRLLVTAYEDDTVRCVAHVYTTTYDGPVAHTDGEVVWGTWMTLAELALHLANPDWPFVPDTRWVLTELAAGAIDDYAALGLGEVASIGRRP